MKMITTEKALTAITRTAMDIDKLRATMRATLVAAREIEAYAIAAQKSARDLRDAANVAWATAQLAEDEWTAALQQETYEELARR